MDNSTLALFYILVGLAYWSINIFVRKLHTKNDEGDGWFLAPLWLLMWPLCFAGLGVALVLEIRENFRNKI